jgi:uncharacterized protein (DUF58 family)
MSAVQAVQPEVLARLGNLSLTARQAVESILSGQHRSVHHGLSVEFADHREYQPGDDLRHLDWLVLARSDRYQIRRYEEETRLRATIALDSSGSMGYGPAGGTKMEFARSLAAALGYLMVRQNDSVGLATFDTEVREFLPPGSTMAHYLNLLDAMSRTKPGAETRLSPVLDALAGRLKRRGLVLLITDAFDDTEALVQSLKLLRYRKQEVRLFQILDPREVNFPFTGMIEFVGLENEPRLKFDSDRIRAHYRRQFEEHQSRLKSGCHACGVQLEVCQTNEDLFSVLGRALATR